MTKSFHKCDGACRSSPPLANIDNVLRAIDYVNAKIDSYTRVIDSLRDTELNAHEYEAVESFENARLRQYAILDALKRRLRELE